MTVETVIKTLEQRGYKFDILGDQINVILPDDSFYEHNELLDEIRRNKSVFLSHLRYRDFEEVPPSAGDLHVITVDATNEREMLRWALAVDTGLIALEGKIRYRTGSSTALIRYRCSFPPEWLPDAITRAAKQKYARTLERIHRGEKWLQAHGEDYPEYRKAYDGYLALYENLRKLYVAIGELIDDPMTGYGEVAAQCQ